MTGYGRPGTGGVIHRPDARTRRLRRVGAVVLAGATVAGSLSGTHVVAGAAAPPTAAAAAPASSLRAVPAAERAALERSGGRPPRVTNLAPYADAGGVTLAWRDPAGTKYQRVVVRVARGTTPPASPGSGIPVRVSAHATSAALTQLHANRRYAAAVWTRAANGAYSVRTATRFTTPPVHPRATSVVAGTVTDRTGRPLSGVVVSAENWRTDGYGSARTVTGSGGHYRLVIGSGELLISFDGSDAVGGTDDATGYQATGRLVEVSARSRNALTLSLRRGAALSGAVTDSLGDPLPGIAVYAQPAFNYVPANVGDFGFAFDFLENGTVTDTHGRYVVKGVPPDVVRACFDPDGGDTQYRDESQLVQQCTDTPESVHAGRSVDLGTTTMASAPSGALTGVVVSDRDAPVANVGVTLAIVGHRYPIAFASTARDGSYRIAGLRPGSYRVCVQASLVPEPSSPLGYVSRCRRTHVDIAAGATSRARVTVYPGGSLSGVVRGPDGEPVNGATIVLRTRNVEDWVASTDDRGRYDVPGLRSGRYRICVDATGVTTARAGSGVRSGCGRGAYVVRHARQRIGADLDLSAAGAIRGRVTDSHGHPVKWINVSTAGFGNIGRWASVSTGPSGRFRLVGLTPGTYRLCFSAGLLSADGRNRCSPTKLAVRAGRSANAGTTALAALGTVRAVVTDDSGAPLDGVDVAAVVPCKGFDCEKSPLVDGKIAVAASWTTYGDGSVALPDLPARTYDVCFFGYLAAPRTGTTPVTGYVDRCTPGVDVRDGVTTRVGAVLTVAGAVTGTVTDADGHPLAGVRVSVTGSDAAEVPATPFDDFGAENPAADAGFTAADGTYAIRSVTPGDQRVCFDPTGVKDSFGFLPQCYGGDPGASTGATVAVASAKVTSGVDIVLSRRGKLAGTVTDDAGASISGADIFIFRPGHPREALVGGPHPDGTYRTPGIEPGRYIVCFDARRYAGQCFDDVAWSGFDGDPLPADATVLTVNPGAVTGSVDAVLQHQ